MLGSETATCDFKKCVSTVLIIIYAKIIIIAIRMMAVFQNFMTFDRSSGRRREFYKRMKEIKQ